MKVTGYRELTDAEIELMNEGKELAERVGEFIEKLHVRNDVDHRWVNIGKTDLQKGFMALTRAIAQPTTF